MNAGKPRPEDDAYRLEFASNPQLAARMSIDEYIATRRVDDGLETLAACGAARKEAPRNPLIGNGGQYQVGSDSF